MTHKNIWRTAFCALSVFCVSCKESVPQPGGTASEGNAAVGRDSAGVRIAESRTPSWTDGTRWKLDSVPLTSIGGDETDVQQQFRFINAAVRMSNGNVVIASDNELRLFGPDGKYLRTIAAKGSGPGEFRSLGDLWRLEGDSILATQAIAEGGMKNVLIGPDGAFVREERPDADKYRALGRWGECMSLVLPDRSRITCQKDPDIPLTATNRESKVDERGFSSPGPGLLRQLKRQYIVSPALDTAYPIGITAGIESFGVSINGKSLGFMVHPFYSRSITAAGGSPLRIVTAMNPDYELQVWTPTGRLEQIIRRVGGRRAPNEQERKDAIEEVLNRAKEEHRDPALQAQMAAALPTPDSLPAVLTLFVAATGEILVMREGFLPSQARSIYDVFDRNGTWLGELNLPRRTRISDVGSDYLLAIRYDSNDVPRAEVFRLHR